MKKNNFNVSNLGIINQLKRLFYGLSGIYKHWNNLNEKNLMEYLDFGNKGKFKSISSIPIFEKKIKFYEL
jgi:hypothetical protein